MQVYQVNTCAEIIKIAQEIITIKILYIIPSLKKCGPVNVLYNIVKYFDSREFIVTVLTLTPEPVNSRIQEFKLLGIKVIQINAGWLSSFFIVKKLNMIILEDQIDIVHGHGFRSDSLVSRLRFKKTFSTLHNYPYNDYLNRYGKIIGTFMAAAHIRFVKNISLPIACSQSVSDHFQVNNNINMQFIRNGVDVSIYASASDEEKSRVRNSLDLPLNRKIFISVGHLSDLKDPLTIIKAFNKIKNDSILVLLGDGNLLDLCKNSITNPNILMLGYKKNVKDYLNASDYFISSSLTEGLPNSVLEALSCGLPCILSDIVPHKEIFSTAPEKIGLLFSTGSSEDLYSKINEIIALPYKQMFQNCRNFIKSNLSAEIMSSNYQNIYKSTLGSK